MNRVEIKLYYEWETLDVDPFNSLAKDKQYNTINSLLYRQYPRSDTLGQVSGAAI